MFLPAKSFHYLIILVLLIIGIYGSTISFEYAIDDVNVITQNRFTQMGIKGIPKLFTTDSFAGHYPEGATYDYKNRYYRPLSYISFAIEKQLWGNRPGVSHAINVLIYLLACIIVFYTLQALGLSLHLAGIVTVLFACHPIHTEAVANIKGRDELLSFTLGLLSLYLLISYLGVKFTSYSIVKGAKYSTDSRIKVWGAGISFFAALLSKEQSLTFLVIFPFTILLFCYKDKVKLIRVIAAFVVAFFAYLLLRISFIGLPPPLQTQSILNDYYLNASWVEKAATQIKVLGLYAHLLLFPYPLSWDYSWKAIPYTTLTDPLVITSVVFYAALFILLIGAYYQGRKSNSLELRHHYFVYSWSIGFYLISLSIISNFFINIGGYIGERFLFQASLGFLLGGGLLFQSLFRVGRRWLDKKIVALFFVVSVTCLLSIASYRRTQNWRDNTTIFLRDVASVPQSCKANAAAGGALITLANQTFSKEEKFRLLKQAQFYLRKAIAIYPNYIYPLLDLSRANLQLGDTASAEQLWYQAQKIDPNDEVLLDRGKELAVAHQNKANLLLNQPQLYLREVEKVLSFYKSDPEIWYNAGQMYSLVGEKQKAVAYLLKAIALAPMQPRYHYALGVVYYYLKDYSSALHEWEITLKLDPHHMEAQKGVNFLQQQMNLK